MIKQEDLRFIRNSLGLTQRKMADLLHCTERAYSSYERMERNFPVRVAELLRFKIDEANREAAIKTEKV